KRYNVSSVVLLSSPRFMISSNDFRPGVSNVIVVTSVDNQGRLSSFANFGAKSVHLAAPGNNIYSTNARGNYGNRSGTSMATSFVTGAAAMVTGLRPEWNYRNVIDQLLASVRELDSLRGRVASGGMLNLAKAVRVPARPRTPPTFSGPGPSLSEVWVAPAGSVQITPSQVTPVANSSSTSSRVDAFVALGSASSWLDTWRSGRRGRLGSFTSYDASAAPLPS
ncbi:MAG: S8 family serine peptidase, partial [Gemmataceae bacterium]